LAAKSGVNSVYAAFGSAVHVKEILHWSAKSVAAAMVGGVATSQHDNRAIIADQKGEEVQLAASASLDLFVSHSSVDADLVAPLVDLLQDALGLEPDRIRATSIDGYRLTAGIPFEEALRRETHDARAFLGVISPASLNSTYVAFELGSRWGANRHLVPLLTPEITANALQGPLATLNAMKLDDRGHMEQLIADLATELNVRARPPHQYSRQLEQLLTAAAHRRQSPPLAVKDALPDVVAVEDSDVDYAWIVERFDMLMDLQLRLKEQGFTETDREKLESMQDSVKDWIRQHRLQADPEIVKDADNLMGMLREERRAHLKGLTVGFAEEPQMVFERLVKRVQSKRRRV
jgi:TIR domain